MPRPPVEGPALRGAVKIVVEHVLRVRMVYVVMYQGDETQLLTEPIFD